MQDRKLFGANSADDRTGSSGNPQSLGHEMEHLVAVARTETVVDDLEVAEIDDTHGNDLADPLLCNSNG